jgi:hypothetical protein
LEIRDQSSQGHLGPVGIGDALRDLILDLAAPEEEPKPEAPEAQTNFDKWKAALKPEDLVFKETDPLGDPKTIWAVWNISGNACDSCPAREVCHEEHEKTGKSRICGQAFKKWANKEIEPKEKTK